LTLSRTSDALLALTRLGTGNAGGVLPDNINWSELKALAEQHGLSAVVLDGIERLQDNQRPPQEFLLEWIGDVFQNYEYTYEQYCKAIAEMAGFYNAHGCKMMVLKGYACSLDWPKPSHRPCGDIDIWLFGKQKDADIVLAKEKGIKIDSSHHHHTVFYWRDFMVENHYDFINVHHHRSNVKIEKILKELGQDDSHCVELYSEKVYLPSPNLHALFLLKHLMMHFAAEGIMLRQLLDWGFYAKAHSKEIDWNWLVEVLKQYGMLEMFNTLNAICIEDFGFATSVFPRVQFNPYIKDRVLMEIINPKYGAELPKWFLTRFIFKIRRWKANEWKHRLCYRESMWSAFWSGVWNHILKPASI
jgi:hypothetical protein